MNDNDLMVVILEDEDFASLTDSYSKAVIDRWRSVRWVVQGIHGLSGRFYAIEIDAQTSVEARNKFVARMAKERRLENNWQTVKVRKL
jgi:hypothetical protein